MKMNNEQELYNRSFEQHSNIAIPLENYIIVRLDGKGFSKFTKNYFKKPFDTTFRDLMVNTTEYLYNSSGFNITYAYTQSDEISLLLKRDDNTFNRRPKKIMSILASMASVYFSLECSKQFKTEIIAIFDATLDIRPNLESVLKYFIWRQDDSIRNCLNGYAYWTLINKDCYTAKIASRTIENQSNYFKKELLLNRGINFDDVPNWQKRGIGFYSAEVPHIGHNPITNKEVITTRKVVEKNYDLPAKHEYSDYIKTFVI